jgi:hypothetical protein
MPSRKSFKVVFIGDVVGQPGRDAVVEFLPRLRARHEPVLVIANGENAAGGTGLTPPVIDSLRAAGIDVITSGNHVWSKREVVPELAARPYLLRPANYPPGAPGRGAGVFVADGIPLGVVNLCGRVFMAALDCPFRAADLILAEMQGETPFILVDIHAEATSEKEAMGYYLDGRVSAVVGTHTHVQTSDARILPRGTAYLSDVGMSGPSDSVLGVKKELILQRFLTQMPQKFEVARGDLLMEGAVLEIHRETGKGLKVLPFRFTHDGSFLLNDARAGSG